MSSLLLKKLCRNWEPLLLLIKEDLLSIGSVSLLKGFGSALGISECEKTKLNEEKASPSKLLDKIDVKLSTCTIPEKFCLFESAYSVMKLHKNFKSMVKKFISFDSSDDYNDFVQYVCKESMSASDDFMTSSYVDKHPYLFDSDWMKWMQLFQKQILQNVEERMKDFIFVLAHMALLCSLKSFASNCKVSDQKLYEIRYRNKNDYHESSVDLVDYILEHVLKDKTLKDKVLFFYREFERSALDFEFVKLLRKCKILVTDPEISDPHRIFCSMASRRVSEMAAL